MDNNYIKVHHGARAIQIESLIRLIPGISDIKNTIDQFREVAYHYNHSNKIKEKLYTEKFNNNISILAPRGMGKSSTMITTINQIKSSQYFIINREIKENTIDILNPMIDPEDIGENSDILGWVITALKIQIDKIIKEELESQSINTYLKYSDKNLKELKIKTDELMNYYMSRDKDYSNLLLNRSISEKEYKISLENTLNNDFKLLNCFNQTVNMLVNYKREINRIQNINRLDKDIEPLIYFFFDDVDMSSKKSVQILKDILSFFAHPNIVIIISGDYDVFKHSLANFFLNETKDITLKMDQEGNQNEIDEANGRAEYFLKKVLPPAYRYYIDSCTDQIKMNTTYDAYSTNILEQMNILELLSYNFCLGLKKDKNNQSKVYLKAFIIPKIEYDNDYIFESDDYCLDDENYILNDGNYRINFLYSYLAVFSQNMRGFMNVYNYLCKQAKEIQKENYTKEYWTIERFSEFLNVLLCSKYTYQKQRDIVKKFISIKDFGNKNNNVQPSTQLRIDCEELQIIIQNRVKQIKKELQNSKRKKERNFNDSKQEIISLIMLPVLVNELFYSIYQKEYELRYKRIKDKLKNILCNTFVNSLNDKIIILPQELGMRRTLCIVYSVVSRMSIESLYNLEPVYDINYISANNKKYIVQLYYATLLLGSAGATYNDNKVLFEFGKYEEYKKSTYTNEEERLGIEKDIAKEMNGIFSHLDRNWLEDKIKFATMIEPTILKIENKLRENHMKNLKGMATVKMKENLNKAYDIVCHKYINLKEFENIGLQYYLFKLLKLILDICNSNSFNNTEPSKEILKNINVEEDLEKALLEDLFNNKSNEFNLLQINKNILNSTDSLENSFKDFYQNYQKLSHFNKSKKEHDLYDFLDKQNILDYMKTELDRRIKNLSSYNNGKSLNTDLVNSIKLLLNSLNDFKMNFEILESKFSNLYEDYISMYENYFFQIIKDVKIISDTECYNIIHENILMIFLSCIDYDKVSVRKNTEEMQNDLNKHLGPQYKIEFDFEKIENDLTNLTNRYVHTNYHEIQPIKKFLEKYMQVYYLYLFIEEYMRIISLNDVKFFKNFKEKIDYATK